MQLRRQIGSASFGQGYSDCEPWRARAYLYIRARTYAHFLRSYKQRAICCPKKACLFKGNIRVSMWNKVGNSFVSRILCVGSDMNTADWVGLGAGLVASFGLHIKKLENMGMDFENRKKKSFVGLLEIFATRGMQAAHIVAPYED